MTIPEEDSDRRSESGADLSLAGADLRLALAVSLTLAVLGAMTVFALLAIRAGLSAQSVAGLAATLCGAAATVAVRVVPGGKEPGRQRSWGPSAATEDPHPGAGEPSERQDRGAL
jgi:hypothetical protein